MLRKAYMQYSDGFTNGDNNQATVWGSCVNVTVLRLLKHLKQGLSYATLRSYPHPKNGQTTSVPRGVWRLDCWLSSLLLHTCEFAFLHTPLARKSLHSLRVIMAWWAGHCEAYGQFDSPALRVFGAALRHSSHRRCGRVQGDFAVFPLRPAEQVTVPMEKVDSTAPTTEHRAKGARVHSCLYSFVKYITAGVGYCVGM